MPRSALVVAVMMVLLTGCATAPESVPTAAPSPSVTPTPTPTPTPEPTGPPPLSELVATVDGLGPLVIGQQPPVTGVTDIAFFDAACVHGYEDALVTGAWRAAYPNIVPSWDDRPDAPFRLYVDETGVARIDIKSSEIRTPEGIGVGSTRAEVLAAYPQFDEIKTREGSATAYGLTGERGWLMIEVADSDHFYPIDTVIALRVANFDPGLYITASTDNVISTCVDGE